MVKVIPISKSNWKFVSFKVTTSAKRPKLATNYSHYLLADETSTTEVEVGGQLRPAKVVLKIWVPIPRGKRKQEAALFARKAVAENSPILL